VADFIELGELMIDDAGATKLRWSLPRNHYQTPGRSLLRRRKLRLHIGLGISGAKPAETKKN
jgi:hypothetical protein